MGDEINQLFANFQAETDIFKKAILLRTLKLDKDVKVIDMSKRLNMKSSYISHILRLNKLPPLIIDGYYSKAVTPTHLYILARLKTQEQMIAAYEHILANNLSVLETELIVRTVLYGVKHEGEYLNEDEKRAFIVEMRKHGLEIKIVQSRIRVKCIIEIKGSLLDSSVKIREIMRLLQKYSQEGTKPDFL